MHIENANEFVGRAVEIVIHHDVVVAVGKGNAGGAVLQRGAGKDSVDNAGFGQCRQDFVLPTSL